jgi:uncharacterized protein (TIGR03000 family)
MAGVATVAAGEAVTVAAGGSGYGGCWGGGYAYGCCGGRAGGYAYGSGWGGSYAYGWNSGYSMPYQYGYGMPYVSGRTYQSGYYGPNQNGQQSGIGERGTAPETVGPPRQTMGPAPATIIVNLPAEAKLTIDDEPTRSASDERVFISPPLEPGKSYTYVLKAEMERNGEKVKASQNVVVRAGRPSRVTLEFPDSNRGQK